MRSSQALFPNNIESYVSQRNLRKCSMYGPVVVGNEFPVIFIFSSELSSSEEWLPATLNKYVELLNINYFFKG